MEQTGCTSGTSTVSLIADDDRTGATEIIVATTTIRILAGTVLRSLVIWMVRGLRLVGMDQHAYHILIQMNSSYPRRPEAG